MTQKKLKVEGGGGGICAFLVIVKFVRDFFTISVGEKGGLTSVFVSAPGLGALLNKGLAGQTCVNFAQNKEIQSGAVAKSYMRMGFLIYEETRKYFPIYGEAVSYI